MLSSLRMKHLFLLLLKIRSVNVLNNDSQSISTRAYNWKMLFNSDPSKPVLELKKCYFQEKRKFSFVQT